METNVELEYMSTKKLKRNVEKIVEVLSDVWHSHCKMLNEMVIGDGLEYDPTMNYVDYNDDDNSFVCDSVIESDDDEEEE